ncbi:hypothetical protein EW146_g573 [Bondarzewia mesenterica]|uniref:DUF7598 domain-containing protein n=1 Tax=Bondarzewia mesenterica TaxID=1095465 RepID=A0A4S4MCW5_9AGAM|nr:hypothetical protein EW146_g573 [Bondarzewia mesenterica]
MMPPRALYFIGLNAVRALSIISLILVFSSSIYVMVNDIKAMNNFAAGKSSGNLNSTDDINCDYIEDSTVPNQPAGVFWAVVNRLLIIFQVIFLILSEIEWPMSFFDRFFPVLGSEFGLGSLGIFQCLIGATILSHHVDDFTLVAAFLLFSVGCLNMVLGLIFRASAKPKRSIATWRAEKASVLPTSITKQPTSASSFSSSFRHSLFGDRKTDTSEFGVTGKAGYGFGRQGETKAGLKGFLLTKPVESLPRYATRPPSGGSLPPASPKSVPTFRSSPTAL